MFRDLLGGVPGHRSAYVQWLLMLHSVWRHCESFGRSFRIRFHGVYGDQHIRATFWGTRKPVGDPVRDIVRQSGLPGEFKYIV